MRLTSYLAAVTGPDKPLWRIGRRRRVVKIILLVLALGAYGGGIYIIISAPSPWWIIGIIVALPGLWGFGRLSVLRQWLR